MGLGVQIVELHFNPLDIRDRKEEKDVLVGYQARGDMSTNEVRQESGLGDPVDGGNDPYFIVGGKIVFIKELPEIAKIPLMERLGLLEKSGDLPRDKGGNEEVFNIKDSSTRAGIVSRKEGNDSETNVSSE